MKRKFLRRLRGFKESGGRKATGRLLGLTGFALMATAVYADTHLYINAKTGSATAFELSSVRRLTFTEDRLSVVPATGSPQAFAYADVQKLTFGDAPVNGLRPAAAASVSLVRRGAEVIVSCPASIAGVRLYNAQGALLHQQPSNAASATLSLAGFPKGIYLLQVIDGTGQAAVYKVIY